MGRHRRYTAVVQDGALTVWIVRVLSSTIQKASVAALAKARKEARRKYPDDSVRKLMTKDSWRLIALFHGHARDGMAEGE